MNTETDTLCSIVIGVRNGREYIGRAVESVICQSYRAWELIIVDDGSEDDTVSVIKSYDDPRIKYIRQDAAGISQARNTGIGNASGKYLVFLDADDTLTPASIEMRVSDMKSHDVQMCWYSHTQCRPDGTEIMCMSGSCVSETAADFLCRAKNFEAGRTVGLEYVWDKVFDLEFVSKNNVLFDTAMDIFEDRRYIMSVLSAAENIYVSSESCMRYYINAGSTSHSKDQLLYEKTERCWNILHDFLKEKAIKDRSVWEGFYHGYINKIIGIYIVSDENEKTDLAEKLKKSSLFSVGIKKYRTRNEKESEGTVKELLELVCG